MARRIPARPTVERLKRLPGRLSLVWLLPLGAVLIAAFVLWRAYVDRGLLVEIRFDNASGVQAGETRVRRNDVDVGRVEAVRLAEDLNSVIVEARLVPEVAPYIDTDARFWIVSARINTTEISGLSTLLSGSFLEVDWDDEAGERKTEFRGMAGPPLTKRGTEGMRVTLKAEEAGYIYVGSPVFLRQIEVGRVERRRLSGDGMNVLFDIFVEAPYHKHVYPETRFYGVSGVEAEVNAQGASVRVESIAALFTGGIAFETNERVASSKPLMRDGVRFRLYDNRTAARDSVFDGPDDEKYRFIAEFDGSVKGLRADAPIEYNGLQVGRVDRVSIELPKFSGDTRRVYAVLEFQPRRMGFDGIDPEALQKTLQTYVGRGLRVQLASGNLLTGSLIVKLVDKPELPPAEIDFTAKPYPALPALPSNVEAVTADVETLVRNLSELPLDGLVTAATQLLVDTRSLVSNPDILALPEDLSRSLASIATAAEQVEVASKDLPAMVSALTSASRNADDVLQGLSPDSEIYIELAAAARELRIAAKSIAAFAELLEENPNAVLTGR